MDFVAAIFVALMALVALVTVVTALRQSKATDGWSVRGPVPVPTTAGYRELPTKTTTVEVVVPGEPPGAVLAAAIAVRVWGSLVVLVLAPLSCLASFLLYGATTHSGRIASVVVLGLTFAAFVGGIALFVAARSIERRVDLRSVARTVRASYGYYAILFAVAVACFLADRSVGLVAVVVAGAIAAAGVSVTWLLGRAHAVAVAHDRTSVG